MTRAILLLGLIAASSAAGQNWQTTTQSRQTAGEELLRVRVEHVAGNLQIRPGVAGQLYRLAMRYDDDVFSPRVRYVPNSASLRIDIEGRRGHRNVNWDDDHQALDLRLDPAVPLDLDVRFGAAQARLDLGGLTIARLSIETGASESQVTFDTPNPGACTRMGFTVGAAEFSAMRLGNARCSRVEVEAGIGDILLDLTGEYLEGFDGHVSVQIGLGAVEVRVPDNVGVRLTVRRFLASIERTGFIRATDGSWVTPNWEEATSRIHVDIKAALGGIEVVRVANGSS